MKIDIWNIRLHVIQTMGLKLAAAGILFLNSITTSSGQPMVMAHHLTYDIIYDYSLMQPATVLWTLQASDFAGKNLAKPKYFKQDRFLPPPRVKNSAFSFSGYQRGHLCPSGDRDSRRDWFKDTFYTSNIVPMTAEVNSGAWKEAESFCRQLATDGHRLKIAAGPVGYQGSPASNTSSRPHVPDTLYKLAVCVIHQGEVWFWLVPNDHQPRREIDCRYDPSDLATIIKQEVFKYIQLWIRK